MGIKKTSSLEAQIAGWNRLKSRLPAIAGQTAVSFFKDNFRRQGFLDNTVNKWRKRKDDEGSGRSILVRSGRLKRSIRIASLGPLSVKVGTDVPYAQAHNEGAEITVPVTTRMRKKFWALYRRSGREKYKHMATTTKSQFRVSIPQRQFMGNSAALDKLLEKHVTRRIDEIFKPK